MPLSIRPSEMVDTGGAPVDRNMTIKSAKFHIFAYTKKDGSPALKPDGTPATTVAAELVLMENDGAENVQQYSVGDPNRYEILDGGKSLGPDGITISQSCNFHVLMNALVNAGFPENKLGDDVAVLDGLYGYWIGVPEPKRPGLVRTAEQEARGRVIPVPSVIERMPWEKAESGKKTATGATGTARKAPEGGDEVLDHAVEFVGSVVGDSGSTTRKDLAAKVFSDLAKDPNRDAIAAAIFSPEMQAALVAAGFTVSGETISKG